MKSCPPETETTMLKRSFYLVLLIAVLSGYAGSAYSALAGPPVAIISEPYFTHPPVVENAAVLHDFRIQNTGGSELRIHKVKTD